MAHVWYREDGTPHLDHFGRPIMLGDNLPACPVCGEYLIDGCNHQPKPDPETYRGPEKPAHGWGAPPDPSIPPATMNDDDRPF